ncbi:MAG: thiol:disulfide interchange protein DsbA/DsbL [Gammaproteobacteria bacterium]|nr:MAG: thiol:disulfide interchange protein DsbA/DsbL [Gammaproteobacteria bacterium]
MSSVRTWFLLIGIMFPVLSMGGYEEGVHFIEIPFSESPETGNKVEVREFFWYGCPYCYSLEPVLERWLKNKPKAVTFVRTPAFMPRRINHGKAYYAFEALGKLNTMHGKFFSAVQSDANRLEKVARIVAFVEKNGIDSKAFNKAYNSFDVDRKVKLATQLAQKYGINSVPTMVIDGRYLTNGSMAGGHEGLLKVVNYLVKRVAAEKK